MQDSMTVPSTGSRLGIGARNERRRNTKLHNDSQSICAAASAERDALITAVAVIRSLI